MAEQIEILNGDDLALTIRRLKTAAGKASGASRTHLLSVLRSLNPNAARSRAFKGASSMAKSTKKAAHHKGHKKHPARKGNPTTGTYQLRSVGSSVKTKVAAAGRRAASNFKGLDLMGLLKEGAGIGAGMLASSFVEKQAEKFLPKTFPVIAKAALASGVVAAAAIAFGGTTGFPRSIAAGAIGEAIRSVGRSYAPQYFAGTDGQESSATGYWDENGQWVDTSGMAGITYDPAYPLPMTEDRPEGI